MIILMSEAQRRAQAQFILFFLVIIFIGFLYALIRGLIDKESEYADDLFRNTIAAIVLGCINAILVYYIYF